MEIYLLKGSEGKNNTGEKLDITKAMDIAQKTKNKGTQKIRGYAEQSVPRCMRKK